MREATDHSDAVDAVLLYEQWGWPTVEGRLDDIRSKFSRAVIILDKVDSPDTHLQLAKDQNYGEALAEVWSLSKILGLPGGGVARSRGSILTFRPEPSHIALAVALSAQIAEGANTLDLLKTYVRTVPQSLAEALDDVDPLTAIQSEYQARQVNLMALISMPLSAEWPAWMHKAASVKAAPGIAPLLPGRASAVLSEASDRLAIAGIESALYHFDFAANPLQPDYRLCLAVPMHGLITSSVLMMIARILSKYA